MMPAGAFPRPVRLLIWERAGEMCERCTIRPAVDIHHRCPRKKGGSRLEWIARTSNGVALCRDCHAWAEANRNNQAYELGWRVHQGIAEQHKGVMTIPVVDTVGRIWFLGDDGTKAPQWTTTKGTSS